MQLFSRGGNAAFLIFHAVLLASIVECKPLLVGDQVGWTNYDTRNFRVPDYINWASSQHMIVGDQLVFKYSRGLHNVNLLLSKAAYQSCDFSHAKLLDAGEAGVYSWRASSPGLYYFGCNKKVAEEGNHCGSGQKFAILVRSSPSLSDRKLNMLDLAVSSASSTLRTSVPSSFQLVNFGTSSPSLLKLSETAVATLILFGIWKHL